MVRFRHSSKNHIDAEGSWHYIEYSDDNWRTHSGFGPVPKKVADAIIDMQERLLEGVRDESIRKTKSNK